jgi:hypothetical protein
MTESVPRIYPIGTVGTPWGAAEKALWLSQQPVKRSYQAEVLSPLQQILSAPALAECAELQHYGTLDYSQYQLGTFPLYAVKSRQFDPAKPLLLVTGGVHGYETSGVQGALWFIRDHFTRYASIANVLVLPCISPWGYETINRWNPDAVDPNRSFVAGGPSQEANAVLALMQQFPAPLVHIDLHETTDSDNSEFRPAKAARDGTVNNNWNIPDGFYLVGDTDKPQPAFQRVMIEAVSQVTHVAEADDNGCLIGEPLQQFGVVNYAKKSLALCGGMTDALYVTTTEVYPDSPRATPEQCNQAQVAVICAGFDFALAATGVTV